MTINADRMKIIEMIVKLLAKAESTDFEAEREAFKSKAAEMMAKHQISAQEAVGTDRKFKVFERDHTSKEMETFDAFLINAVANFNGVSFMHSTLKGGARKVHFWFVGNDSDLEVFDYMMDIIKQQRTAAWKSYLADFRTRHGAKSEPSYASWRAWWNGYTEGVRAKLTQLTAMRDSKIEEWGLVVVDQAKQAQAWYEEENKVKQGKSTLTSIGKAGFQAGQDVSIHQGITKQDGVKLIA